MGGVRGCWMVKKFNASAKIFFRGDDGTLLQRKEKANIGVVYPKEYNLSKKDNLNLQVDRLKREVLSDGSTELKLNIKNRGDSSYFILVQGESEHLVIEPQRVDKIEKGKSREIVLKVYARLDSKNPKPALDELNISVITGNGSAFNKSVPIAINYADINVTKAEVSEDRKNLNLNIENIGDEAPKNAKVKLLEPFVSNVQDIDFIEAKKSKPIAFAIDNNFSFEDNMSVALSVYIPNVKLEKENPKAEVEPAYVWQRENVKIVLNKLAWYIYALWAVGILALLGAIYYYKRYKNPLVVKLSQTPSELMNLNIEELKEAKERLTKIDRFKNILAENSISGERYDHAIAFVSLDNESRANYFAKRVFASLSKLDEQSYVMALHDDFPLNVKQFILFLSDKENIDDMMSDIKNIPQYRTHIIVIVSNSSEAQAKIYERKEGYEKFVVLHPKTLTQTLLSVDGSKVLATSFSEQLALTQISPYQLGGGVTKSSMFFGRGEIVSHILGRENGNYIIIGSRQIGKSSLLKAIEREYHKGGERAYYISLNEGSLVRGIAKALRIKVKTLDDVVSYILQSEAKYIFLIDEADKFMVNERANNYEVLNNFRKLSEEGRCNFLLAGFWEIYQHAVLDYQSPLKNFGETIELGALEPDACREMIVKPMGQLGLKVKEEVVEEIVERTGQRANLIAIICSNIIKNLGKTKKVIELEDAQKAIKEKNVYELFEAWRELNDDKRANRLDRIVVYATVKKGEFTLAELIERLKIYGLEVDIADLEKSLDRLKVSYTIRRGDDGVYAFMLPLFRAYILKGDYEVKLRGEVKGYQTNKRSQK